MENISEHISYQEGIVSATGKRKGIKNDPPLVILDKMKITAEKLFEPLRAVFGPIIIISFYRCPELNKAVGGAKNSQHIHGEAIDIQATGKWTNADIFNYLRNSAFDWDQIIAEFPIKGEPAWIHISYSATNNRRNALIAVKLGNGKTKYLPYEGNEKYVNK